MIYYIKYIFGFLILFFYVYSVYFNFIPYGIPTRVVISIIAIYHCRSNLFKIFNPESNFIFAMFCIFVYWLLLVLGLNFGGDIYWLRVTVLWILYFLGAILVIDALKIREFNKLLLLIICCVLINNLIAFSALFIPILRNFLIEVQYFTRDVDTIESTFRCFGLGNIYWSGGAKSALAGIFACYLFKIKYLKNIQFYIIYVILLFTGILIARTALVGLLGLIFLIFPLKQNLDKIIPLVCILPFFLLAYYLLKQTLMIINPQLADWAFELFDNISESGTIQTSSTNHLFEMWNVTVNSFKTLLIGDNLMNDSSGGYYMHTDVGYLRIIFSMGIIGLCLFISMHIKIIQRIVRLANIKFIFGVVLFLYILLLLVKGVCDVMNILFLLYVYCNKSYSKCITIN